MSPERIAEILESRAKVLARPVEEASGRSEVMSVITFGIDGRTYAVEAEIVREIVKAVEIVRVPGLPAVFRGVTNLRGEIIDLIDLGIYLGTTKKPSGNESYLVIVGRERAELGFVTEDVGELTELMKEEIISPAKTSLSLDRVRGVTSGSLIVVNGEHLLRDAEVFVTEQESI